MHFNCLGNLMPGDYHACMRKLVAAVVFLCGAASVQAADGEDISWCDGPDRLTIEDGQFYLNGKRIPNSDVEDAAEEDFPSAFEYGTQLFLPCDDKKGD